MECSKGCKSVTIILAVLLAGALGYIAYLKAPCCTKATGPVDAEDVVVATVGGENVWLSEVVAFHDANPQLKNVPIEAVYKEIFNYIVEGKALSQAALKAGVKDSDKYKKALKDAAENVLRSVYIETEIANNITEDKLKTLYDEFIKKNPGEDEVRASHILVDSEKDAKKIIAKLNKGEDFATLAKEKSKDANGANGGDLGFFKKSAMVPEFAKEAFSMKVGEISQKPVKTMFGFHIIKVTDKRKAAPVAFDKIKDSLKMKEAQTLVPKILTKAKDDAKIVNTPAAFENKVVSLDDGKKDKNAGKDPVASAPEAEDAEDEPAEVDVEVDVEE